MKTIHPVNVVHLGSDPVCVDVLSQAIGKLYQSIHCWHIPSIEMYCRWLGDKFFTSVHELCVYYYFSDLYK